MNSSDLEKFAELRRKAEQVLIESPERLEEMPPETIRELVQEMLVRGVELEIQNEDLRKVQTELELSRDRYVELYDFAPVGYLTLDKKGSIIQANLAACALLKVTRNLLLTLPFKDYVDTTHWNVFENHLRVAAETWSKQACELKLVTRDQTTVDVQVVILPIDNPDGDDEFWYRATLTDISERKRQEESLRQTFAELDRRVDERTRELAETNEQLKQMVIARERLTEVVQQEREVLQKILDNIPVMLCFYDSCGEIKMVNRAFERRLGWSLDQLHQIDDPMAEFYPDSEYRNEVWQYMLEASPGWKDFKIRLRDGKELDTSWANVRLSDNSQIGIGIDVTERKITEKALQESREKYRSMTQNLPGVVYKGHRDWSVEFIDEKVKALTGYQAEQFYSGRRWCDLILEEDLGTAKEATIQALKTDGSFIREYRIRTKDGKIRWVQDRGATVCNERGKIHHVDGVFFDITERKLLDEQLVEQQRQLRSLASELVLTEERERRSLAEDLHDSIGQALALSKLRVDSLKHTQAASKISPELESLSKALDDIIDQTHSMVFQLSPPVLYQMGFTAALEYLAELIEKRHNIRIAVNSEIKSLWLREDESVLLFRAVQELLTNVIKHAEASKSSITLKRTDYHLQIEVQDDGVGFDTTVLEAERSLKKRFGLFSVRERLHHLGGYMQVESSPGSGTKVCMVAPLSTETDTTVQVAQ
jgi:PAS domain S-box-containing protein